MIEGRIFHLTDERVSAGLLRCAMSASEREGERRRIVGLALPGDIVKPRYGEAGRIDLWVVLKGDGPAENDGKAPPSEPISQLRSACFYDIILIARAHVSFVGERLEKGSPLRDAHENIMRTYESSEGGGALSSLVVAGHVKSNNAHRYFAVHAGGRRLAGQTIIELLVM